MGAETLAMPALEMTAPLWRLNPYALSLILTAPISGAMALFALRRRRTPGAIPFAWLMLALSLWTLGYGIELGSQTLNGILWCVRFEYLGIAGMSVAWLWFTLAYAGYGGRPLQRLLIWLGIVPALTVLLNWTNPWHHLYYVDVGLDISGPFPLMSFTRGPGYWVYVAYFYGALVAGTILLVRVFLRSTQVYRNQALIILLGTGLPWVANIAYMAGISPFGSLDLTPYAFTATGLAAAWGLFRHRLLDLGPVARHRLVESLADSVITLDALSRIVDLNPSAEELLGLPIDQVIGQPITRFLAGRPDLVAEFEDSFETHSEIRLERDGSERFYELSISPLYNRLNRVTGRLVVLHDVTGRILAEEELRRAKALAEERSLAAEAANRARSVFLANVSHELRTPLNAIMGFSEILQQAPNLNPQQHESVVTIHENGARLLQLVNAILELTSAEATAAADGMGWEGQGLPLETAPAAGEGCAPVDVECSSLKPRSTLPPGWLAELRQAAAESDFMGLHALADRIRAQEADLADQLAVWIDNFAYDQILTLSDELQASGPCVS